MSTPNDDRPIRILHLSDLHFRADKVWDADPVLRALTKFIAQEVKSGLLPDLVAITGDLAFAGTAGEYRLARDWLAEQLWPALPDDFSHDRLLLVPGNHDVDRRRVGQGVRHIQDGLLSKQDQNGIAALLKDDNEREVMLKRHAAYLEFLGGWLGEVQPLPWWQRSIEIRGVRLHVAGLDSAWMAYRDEERGDLLLGRYQVNQTVLSQDADDAHWRLALLHHPWDYLAEFDGHEARSTIHQHCDLLLRGHLHQPQSEQVVPSDPSRACLELAAGCVYEHGRYPNAFQWIELHPRLRRIKVLYRAWIEGEWDIDRNRRGCPNGEAEFDRPSKNQESTPGPPAVGPAFRRYYEACDDRWSQPRYALDKRFVHLTLLLDQGEETQGPRWTPQARTFQDLREVLAAAPDPALVLLGPPGSGKSTLLRHFELDNARTVLAASAAADPTHGPVTFFVALNGYGTRGADPPPRPLDWLVESWKVQYPDLPPLDTLLRQRRVTLLLDALNEMPQAGPEPLRCWKAFLADLSQRYPGNRVIFSCRSLDYSATLSSKDLPVPQVRIEALSDAQIQEFLQLYCPDHHAVLWRNLANSPQLEVLRSPYFLNLLVKQTTHGEIPTGRAALFGGFARQALQREIEADHPLFQAGTLLGERDRVRFSQPRSWKTPHELPRQGILFDKLSSLAFQMQARRQPGEASQVRIGYPDALDLLAHDRADDVLKAGEALGVLEEDLGQDEVLYVHQLLQEYFAARWLAAHPEPRWVQVEWRADHVSPSLQDTLASLADSDPLPPLPGTGWEETAVLAAALADRPDAFVADLVDANLALAGRCAAQPDVPVSDALKDRIRQALLQRTRDPAADLRARIAAGLALGELGDPRWQRCRGPHGDYLLPPLIAIPGGAYAIGSDEGLYDDEAPVHAVDLQPFQLGQFPVTHAEYALFVKAGGYEDDRWWDTESARAWRRGEGTAAGAKQHWRENRQYLQANFDDIRNWQRQGRITSKQADNWERYARMDDDAFEALLEAWYPPGRQTQPAFWNDEAFNNPAQPVVGVCWYEARAYCAWLSAQTGRAFRLPTEAEWEAAARGSVGRRYAYGDAFDASLCNAFETHIRRPTPVGVFPGDETPDRLIDMTGNTWDWNSSLYRPYPYVVADGREDPAGATRRVGRGGAWLSYWPRARAACRSFYAPDSRSIFLGFRLACSSPI